MTAVAIVFATAVFSCEIYNIQTRLKHALKKSLEAEDYERSAELRDRLKKKGRQ